MISWHFWCMYIYINMYVCVCICVYILQNVFSTKKDIFFLISICILNIHIPTICFIEYEICIVLLNVRYVICVTNMPIDIVFNKFKSSNETQNFNKILHESHGPFSNLMGLCCVSTPWGWQNLRKSCPSQHISNTDFGFLLVEAEVSHLKSMNQNLRWSSSSVH